MIDIHTHILPQMDDGAFDVAVAKSLMEREVAQGVETIVLTPHYYGRKRSPQKFLKERDAAFEKIKAEIPTELKVVLGAEVYFTEIGGASFDEMKKLSLGNTRYVLLEFPFGEKWKDGLIEKLEDFMAKTNVTPVLAHLERYRQLRRKPQLLQRFLNMGCLLQVNVGSFLGKRTRRLAFKMLENGMISAFGTDAHNGADRAPNYDEAKKAVSKRGMDKAFEKVQENMQAILNDESVRVSYKAPVKKFLWWYY